VRHIVVAAALASVCATASAQAPNLVAPPRTVADIAAILEQEKFDPARFSKLNSEAGADTPVADDQKALAEFYYRRASARIQLGKLAEATRDAEAAVAISDGQTPGPSRFKQLLGLIYGWGGDLQRANELFASIEREIPKGQYPPALFVVTRWIGINMIQLGDLGQAEGILQRNQDNLAEVEKKPNWSSNPSRYLIEAHVTFGNAMLFEARGRFHEAAIAFTEAEGLFRSALGTLSQIPNPPTRANVEELVAWMPARAGRALAREGKLADAEISARRAVLAALNMGGKYNLNTARVLLSLAMTLVEEGRYAEAETLTRNVLGIYQALGVERDSYVYAACLNQLAALLALQNRWPEAAQTYDTLDRSTATWNEVRKDQFSLDITRIFTLYNIGKLNEGIGAARRLADLNARVFGTEHPETALARGTLAVGEFRAGRRDQALSLFRSAAPILLARDPQADDDDATAVAARQQRVQTIIETYIELLAQRGGQTADESFRLAEAIRSSSVDRALAQSSARAVAGDQALGDLARREQDLEKQIGAQLGLLNNVLSSPPEQRDNAAVAGLQRQIDELRASHAQARTILLERFPEYAALLEPKPPTIDTVKATLAPSEALLSFYFGRGHGFVWAIPKHGPARFAEIPIGAEELERVVGKLREALEPNATTLADIPPFDVALANRLDDVLLKPVDVAWRDAKNLIVATNGALASLPLGLLPMAAAVLERKDGPLFAEYRNVPWLIRSHAVTIVPSAAALVTLRRLPAGSGARDKFVGFGDPYFNAEEAAEAAEERADPEAKIKVADASTTRGLPLRRRSVPQTAGLDSANLGLLPRLPDTAEELRSIATALGADAARSLHLGKDANEQVVRTIGLSKFKIVDFATHGLRPGDLDGLTQPALALTAPSVAGVDGDGLLTMGEILSLKLDADWVVLSACNSGAGATANAEAASGLARAFFYAGSRAILVTNWSVHSASARQLVADLFRRQTDNPAISRAEALRQAMVAMIDRGGYKDEAGNMLFSYAHPLFWAPYSVIGDGGMNR
jgi:CHAT domain-containing protein/tetratricopeptide (TPR) repeat protein